MAPGFPSRDAKGVLSNGILLNFWQVLIGHHLGSGRIPFLRIVLLCNMIGETVFKMVSY